MRRLSGIDAVKLCSHWLQTSWAAIDRRPTHSALPAALLLLLVSISSVWICFVRTRNPLSAIQPPAPVVAPDFKPRYLLPVHGMTTPIRVAMTSPGDRIRTAVKTDVLLQAAPAPAYVRLQPITSNLDAPTAIAVDVDENIYVTESIHNHLLIYDQNGAYLRRLSGLDRPISVTVVGDGRILVGNAGRGNVEVYDANLNLLHKLGSGDGEFSKPCGIAVDSAGNVYVADGKEDRIKVYNPDGTPEFSFGTSGSEDGQFHFPVSIAIDEISGEIIVSDLQLTRTWSGVSEGARLQVFDMNGEFLRSFGEFGEGEGLLIKPLGVTVDGDGRIYVTDAYQNVVQVFDGDGTSLGAVYDRANPMRTPLGIAIGKNSNRLFVASLNTSRVEVYQISSMCCE